jgi:hypothetical protein
MEAPTKEDVAKLHSEINLYLTQRITLLISAISVVGVVLAWVTQKANPSDYFSLEILFLGGTLLMGFLSIIHLMDLSLEISIAILASYLRHASGSPWERAAERYRSATWHPIRHITPRRLVYLSLGTFAAAWPFLIGLVLFKVLSLSLFGCLHLFASAAFFVFVLAIGPRLLKRRYASIEKKWAGVLAA